MHQIIMDVLRSKLKAKPPNMSKWFPRGELLSNKNTTLNAFCKSFDEMNQKFESPTINYPIKNQVDKPFYAIPLSVAEVLTTINANREWEIEYESGKRIMKCGFYANQFNEGIANYTAATIMEMFSAWKLIFIEASRSFVPSFLFVFLIEPKAQSKLSRALD